MFVVELDVLGRELVLVGAQVIGEAVSVVLGEFLVSTTTQHRIRRLDCVGVDFVAVQLLDLFEFAPETGRLLLGRFGLFQYWIWAEEESVIERENRSSNLNPLDLNF